MAVFGFQTHTNMLIGAVCVANLILGGYAFLALWRQDKDFICEIDSEKIRCVCPSASMGDTFEIAIKELQAIIVDSDRPKIELVDSQQIHYWLTFNFGNPAWRFVHRIRQLRPDIEYTE